MRIEVEYQSSFRRRLTREAMLSEAAGAKTGIHSALRLQYLSLVRVHYQNHHPGRRMDTGLQADGFDNEVPACNFNRLLARVPQP